MTFARNAALLLLLPLWVGTLAEAGAETIFQVPTARIGDRVAYTLADGNPGPGIGFEVQGVGFGPDADGALREVLRVRVLDEPGDEAWEHVDLAHRLRVGSAVRWKFLGEQPAHQVDLRPGPAALPGLELQGRSLRVGDSIDLVGDLPPRDEVTRFVFGDAGLLSWKLRFAPDTRPREPRAWVAAFEAVEGRNTMVVRFDVENPILVCDEENKRDCSERGRLLLRGAMRMADDFPYPLQLDLEEESRPTDEPAEFRRSTWVLTMYEPGQGPPVVWRQYGERLPFRRHNPDLERGASSDLFPREGAHPVTGYPLEEAVSDAWLDGRLSGFQAWRAQHPAARLVSAELSRGDHEVPFANPDLLGSMPNTVAWQLGFAEPSGAGYVVALERLPGGGTTLVKEYGTARFEPFSEGDLPTAPVTFGAAARLARAFLPETERWPIDVALWGDEVDVVPRGDGPWDEAAPDSYEIRTERLGFRTLSLGHQSRLHTPWMRQSGFEIDLVSGVASGGGSVGADTAPSPAPAFAPTSVRPRFEFLPQEVRAKPQGLTDAAVWIVAAMFVAGAASIHYRQAVPTLALRLLVWWPGYTLLKRDRLLDHEGRDRIVEAVRHEPGIHVSELARRLHVGWGALLHHLAVLERNRVLASVQDGRHRRFFLAGVTDRRERGQLAVLANPRTKQVHDRILQEPGATTTELARASETKLTTLTWHLRRLERVGCVRRQRRGRSVQFFPASAR